MTKDTLRPPAGTPELRREIGLAGAIGMGLGSILGTGVFVSIGIAAGIAGPAALLGLVLAAFVAMCNAFSSAQLAAAHPVSGGTYEYGYRHQRPELGFAAGLLFVLAKSASAGTAALGFAGYLGDLFGLDAGWRVPIAISTALGLTWLVLGGIRRSSRSNLVIVAITLFALACFVFAGLWRLTERGTAPFTPFWGAGDGEGPVAAFLHATAILFVAYTGYGRIATLGEEVHDPRRTIPAAIVWTLGISAALYLGVALVGIGIVSAAGYAHLTQASGAPLEGIARALDDPGLPLLVAIGAMTAMLGVLLNLFLGLSRVVLAMGRRGDLPAATARVHAGSGTPRVATLVIAGLVVALAGTGSVRTTWSFSAFTVLLYYAITNLLALRLAPADRIYPRGFAVLGLVSCAFLAFFVEWEVWLVGLGAVGVGLGLRAVLTRPRD